MMDWVEQQWFEELGERHEQVKQLLKWNVVVYVGERHDLGLQWVLLEEGWLLWRLEHGGHDD